MDARRVGWLSIILWRGVPPPHDGLVVFRWRERFWKTVGCPGRGVWGEP